MIVALILLRLSIVGRCFVGNKRGKTGGPGETFGKSQDRRADFEPASRDRTTVWTWACEVCKVVASVQVPVYISRSPLILPFPSFLIRKHESAVLHAVHPPWLARYSPHFVRP